MKTERLTEWKISPRVVLRPGDRFRVSGGPYWRLDNGAKVPIAVRGVCTFMAAIRRGKVVVIEALSGEGFVAIHVEGRRRRVDASLVCRPYRIRCRVSK